MPPPMPLITMNPSCESLNSVTKNLAVAAPTEHLGDCVAECYIRHSISADFRASIVPLCSSLLACFIVLINRSNPPLQRVFYRLSNFLLEKKLCSVENGYFSLQKDFFPSINQLFNIFFSPNFNIFPDPAAS